MGGKGEESGRKRYERNNGTVNYYVLRIKCG